MSIEDDLVIIGGQQALNLRDTYKLSNDLLKQGLLLGVSIKEIKELLQKVKDNEIDINYNIPLEMFLTYKSLEYRVNNKIKI